MVSSLDLQSSNTSSNLVGNAIMLLWYMGYDTGAQAGEDGSSPSRGFKYGFLKSGARANRAVPTIDTCFLTLIF